MNFTAKSNNVAVRSLGRTLGGIRTLAAFALATVAGVAAAQGAPKYLITTGTTLATPSGFGGPNGNLATDKFGNLFVPDGAQSEVLEYPANGGAPVVIFNATKTGPQVSGVAVDAANNLYITTRYDGSLSASETDIFKFPYSSGGYPAPYVYTGAAPPTCSATSTSVCAYGNFLQITGGYYQPQSIGFDAAGNGYLLTTYDSLNGAGGKTVYECNVQCGYSDSSNPPTIALRSFPTTATSMAIAPNGDIYLADGKDVYYSQAGSNKVSLFDKSYESTYGGAAGVGFDSAGNLYVSNSGGTYEVPSIGGVITAANRFQVAVSTVGGYTGPAVDNAGNVYSAAYSTVLKSSLYNFNFGSYAVGASSAAQTFTLNFLSAGTIVSIAALQGGSPATEFTFSQGTCTPAAHAAGDSCTFTVSFTPGAVGTRRATVVMTDANGVQTYAYLLGVGQGSGLAIDPGTPSAITTSLKAPSGIALDASGNLYVADATAAAVYEYVGASGTPISIGSGFKKPTGVATDGAGNLYVVDQTAGTLSLFVNTGGHFSTVGTGNLLASGLSSPTDVVVSGVGSIYVSNTGKNVVLEYPNASRIASLGSSTSLGINLSGPTGLSLDPSGNLFIADTGNNRVVQLSYAGAQTALGSGLSAPTGVAAEASGSVLIADQGNGRVVRIPNEAGGLTTADQVTLTQPLINPYSIRLNASGSLYLSDNIAGAVDVIQRSTGTLNFGISNVNTPTAPQTIVVSNTGTTSLTLASPFFTPPPAGSNFTLVTGSGSLGCTSGTLTAGNDCTLTSVFTPTSTGTKTYTAPLNTSALNSSSPGINLVGQGVQLTGVTVTLTKTSPAGTVTYGVPVVLSATVASSSASSTAVPTGSVVFNVDGQNTKPVALNASGTATYTLNGLAGNSSHTVVATYTGNATYASGNSTAYTFTVQPASLSAVLTVYSPHTSNASPVSALPGDAVSFSVVITPSVVVSGGLTGTVNFVSGNTILGSSTITQNSSTGVYSAGISLSTLQASCLASETLPNCSNIYQVQAVFAGNGNYAGFSTAATPLIITNPTYTVVASSNTITSTADNPGSVQVTVTSYGGFQGGVSLTCAGLPANAYCIFRPGLISLIATSATTGAPAYVTPQVTTMQIRVSQDPVTIQSASSLGVLGLISGACLFALGLGKRRRNGLLLCGLFSVVSLFSLTALSGCGSSTRPFPTPAGTYAVVLTAAATPIPNGQAPPTANITSIQPCATVAAAISGFTCTQKTGSYVITTQSSTGLLAGQTMTIAASTPSSFNGNYTVLNVTGESVPAANGVVLGYYDLIEYVPATGSPATGASGGTVRLANLVETQNFSLIVK